MSATNKPLLNENKDDIEMEGEREPALLSTDKCPQCNFTVPKGSNFCLECGNSLIKQEIDIHQGINSNKDSKYVAVILNKCVIDDCNQGGHLKCCECKKEFCGEHAGFFYSTIGRGIIAEITKVEGIFCTQCKDEKQWDQCKKRAVCCVIAAVIIIIVCIVSATSY